MFKIGHDVDSLSVSILTHWGRVTHMCVNESLIQKMVCRLFGTRLLSKPIPGESPCSSFFLCFSQNGIIINTLHEEMFPPWWRHQMETFSALLDICAGNSPVPGEFPTQRPVTRSFDVFFDLRLYIRLSKQSWGWWFETLSRSLWRHCNEKYHVVMHLHLHNFPILKWHRYLKSSSHQRPTILPFNYHCCWWPFY